MKHKKQDITALIIVYNEINHIDELISHLDFVSEIIVIDSFSNDGTFEKLNTYPHVKTIQHKFLDFANQRNFAIEQASKEWILFIDADERISLELKKEILALLHNVSDINAFKFRRKFIFQKQIIRFSGLQTDKIYRLFRKGTAFYLENKLVHEQLVVDGKTATLKNYLLHYSFINTQHYKSKTEDYARLKARELFSKKLVPNWYHFYIKPTYKFISNYIFRLGFLDGKLGYIICKLNAYGVWFRYQELKRLYLSPKF